MGRIRVKVVVLPYSASVREEVIAPWIEPCSEDISLQELCDKIVETFADLHQGKGNLNIKRIQDFDGNTLSCRLTVGEAFVESQNIADRTVQVVRLPPDHQELNHPLRYASIAPDSSARPQNKRLEARNGLNARNRLSEITETETWATEGRDHGDGRPSKRQKLQDARPRAALQPDRPLFQGFAGEDRGHRRQDSALGRAGSPRRLVEDSQQSHAGKERNPYGTPTSLSVPSPSHIPSSRRDDELAIPDTPDQRRRVSGNDDPRTYRDVVERAKSESPQLTTSIYEYPSSRSPDNHATQNSSQQITTQRLGQSGHAASSIPLTGWGTDTPARHYSPNTRQSSTNSSSHRNYHILRSTQQERPSQVDPIETDDGLSQEQHVTNDTPRSKLGPSRSTSLHGVQRPHPDSYDDRGTTRSRHVSTDRTSRLRLPSGPGNQIPNPVAVEVSTSFVEDLEAPQNEPPYDSPSRLPALRKPRGEVSEEQSRESVHENVDLNLDEALHPKEDGKLKDHDLEFNATLGVNQEGLNANHTPIPEKVHVSGRVLDHPLNDEKLGENSTNTAPDTIACSRSSSQERVNREEILRLEKAAPAHTQVDAPAVRNKEGASNEAGSKRKELETHVKIAKPAKRLADERGPSAKPVARKEVVTIEEGTESTSKRNTSADIAVTTVARPEEKKIVEPGPDYSTDKREEREEPSQDQKRKAANTAKRRKTRTAKDTAPLDPVEPNIPEDPRFLKPNTIREAKELKPAPADDNVNSTEQQPEEPKITRNGEVDAAEQRLAEEKAKRLTDAIARTVASTKRRQQTPSSGRRKRSVLKQVNETPALDAGVQRLREPSAVTNQPSSSPRIRKESAGQPRSMTPLFPSSCMKPSKGALRTSESSSTRRSVSFNDDPIAPPRLLAPATLTSGGPREGKSKDAAERAGNAKSAAAKVDQSKPKASQSKGPDNAPCTQDITTEPTNSKSQPQIVAKSKTSSEDRQVKPKTQTKLNVTRDVKLKGRAQETARPQKAPKEQEIVISSDNEDSASTFYSDEDEEPRSAKAGPSKKRRTTNTKKSADTIPDSKPRIVQQTNIAPLKTEAIQPCPSDGPEAAEDEIINKARTLEPSRSRSPAQYMSKSRSSSQETESGSDAPTEVENKLQSASESGSQCDTESASDDQSTSGSDVAESEISTKLSEKSSRSSRSSDAVKKSKSTTPLPVSRGSTPAKSSNWTMRRHSNGTLKRPSKATLTRSHSHSVSPDPDDDEKQMAHQTSQQLQREHRESVQASQASAKPVKQADDKKQPTPAPKPANSRFPSLTGLRGRALKAENTSTTTTSQASAKPSQTSKQPPKVEEEATSSGSSSSEDESSDSDDDDDETAAQSTQNSQSTPKSQGRPIRGIREIMNLTRKLRG